MDKRIPGQRGFLLRFFAFGKMDRNCKNRKVCEKFNEKAKTVARICICCLLAGIIVVFYKKELEIKKNLFNSLKTGRKWLGAKGVLLIQNS